MKSADWFVPPFSVRVLVKVPRLPFQSLLGHGQAQVAVAHRCRDFAVPQEVARPLMKIWHHQPVAVLALPRHLSLDLIALRKAELTGRAMRLRAHWRLFPHVG